MLFTLTLLPINNQMTDCVIGAIYVPTGSEVLVGGKLLDLTLTLGATSGYDCPPVSHFRVIGRDRAWLRMWYVNAGDAPAIGTKMALLSTDPNEDIGAKPTRELRVTMAGIIPDFDFGDELP